MNNIWFSGGENPKKGWRYGHFFFSEAHAIECLKIVGVISDPKKRASKFRRIRARYIRPPLLDKTNKNFLADCIRNLLTVKDLSENWGEVKNQFKCKQKQNITEEQRSKIEKLILLNKDIIRRNIDNSCVMTFVSKNDISLSKDFAFKKANYKESIKPKNVKKLNAEELEKSCTKGFKGSLSETGIINNVINKISDIFSKKQLVWAPDYTLHPGGDGGTDFNFYGILVNIKFMGNRKWPEERMGKPDVYYVLTSGPSIENINYLDGADVYPLDIIGARCNDKQYTCDEFLALLIERAEKH